MICSHIGLKVTFFQEATAWLSQLAMQPFLKNLQLFLEGQRVLTLSCVGKVDQSGSSAGDEDIVPVDIAVQDAELMEVCQSLFTGFEIGRSRMAGI